MALGNSDAAIRRKAASALLFVSFRPGMIEERFEPQLLEAVRDSENRVRASAASILGRMSSDAALDAMHKALLEDEDPFVRSSAARALGQRADVRSVEVLARACEDADDDVMASATSTLQRLSPGHPTVRHNVAKLIRIFRTGNEEVHTVASALGAMDTEETIGVLMEGLESKTDMVRYFSLMGLMHATHLPRLGPVARCLKDKLSFVRSTAAMILDRHGSSEVGEWLAPLLDDSDSMVRMMAARALLARGDARGEAALQKLMESRDEHEREMAKAMMATKASLA